ncbi:MAG TPA: hypothetical protein VM802_25405 [Chitinophaga sp.]|nr:hypothetical protein [Chitinophaga sp.]HVI48230.1 hypothetical protein [Chitinophaga sp.]
MKNYTLLKTLISGLYMPFTLDESVTAGVYIYNLEVDGKVMESRKMILTR